MSIEKMSGLEIMQAMGEGKLPMPSIAVTIPMKGVAVEYGRIVFEAMADHRHHNPVGGVNGGFIATVLDAVTGCTVQTTLGPGVGCGTIELNVKMLKAVPQQVPLIAKGTLKDSDGNFYAHATATCMILRR